MDTKVSPLAEGVPVEIRRNNMELNQLFELTSKDEIVKGHGVDNTHVYLKNIQTDMIVRLPIDEIINNTWEDIRSVVVGDRNAGVLQHITRVVGYFSSVNNWNKSKIAELSDRHIGDYNVN